MSTGSCLKRCNFNGNYKLLGMKNWIYVAGLIAFIAISCDKVDDPYEGIATGGEEVVGDTLWNDTTHNFRKMYIEEFTGHTCFNCPARTKRLIEWMESDFAGTTVMTSIHYGGFAEPNAADGYPDDWRCEEGKQISDKYGVLSWPQILVNRLQSNAIDFGQWKSELDAAFATSNAPSLKMKLMNVRDGSQNQNKITIYSEALEDISGDYTVGIMIVTDSLIAPQKDGLNRVEDYAHRYMLRGAVGPSIGNSYISGGMSKGDTLSREFNFEPNPTWDTTHLLLNVFIRNSDTEEIIQTDQIRVTK